MTTFLQSRLNLGLSATAAIDLHQFLPDGRALHTQTFNQSTVQTDYVWLDNLPVAQFQDSYEA